MSCSAPAGVTLLLLACLACEQLLATCSRESPARSSRESLFFLHTLEHFFTLSHSLPLQESHLNTRLLIFEIQANLARNKANEIVDKNSTLHYRLAFVLIGNVTNNSFKGESVWKVMSSPKRCFLWQCCHLSIPVRSILTSRGFNLPDLCTFCNDCLESVVHLLRGFPFARSFWNSFPFPLQQNVFYGTNLVD